MSCVILISVIVKWGDMSWLLVVWWGGAGDKRSWPRPPLLYCVYCAVLVVGPLFRGGAIYVSKFHCAQHVMLRRTHTIDKRMCLL